MNSRWLTQRVQLAGVEPKEEIPLCGGGLGPAAETQFVRRRRMGPPGFDTAFSELVVPVLERLAFRQVPEPTGWMQPPKLYQRERAWLGVELDERDGYVAVTLGRLFRLRDFMPRAIVRGPFHYEVNGQYEQSGLARVLERVAADLPDALKNLEKRWSSTAELEHERWAGSTEGEAGYARYLAALGPELTHWPPRLGESDP